MIELKKDFRRKGIDFHQIHKDDKVVIYQLRQNGVRPWYEIFRYKTREPDIYHDDTYEVYPSDEDFGKWAWSCSKYGVIERVFRDRLKMDIGEYAYLFGCMAQEDAQIDGVGNYEGTEKLPPSVKQGWALYN